MTTEDRYYEMVAAFAPTIQKLKATSGDRIVAGIDESRDRSLTVSLSPKPPGAEQWTTSGATYSVELTHGTDGSIAQDLVKDFAGERAVCDDATAARSLGVDQATWRSCRADIETGATATAHSLRQYDSPAVGGGVHDGASGVSAVGEERAGQPLPATRSLQPGLEKERRDPQQLRAVAPMAGIRR